MSRREDTAASDAGISPIALGPLGALIAEMDAAAVVHIRHFVLPRPRNAPAYAPRRAACGKEGVEPNTFGGTESTDTTTCDACRKAIVAIHAKADKRTLERVRTAPVLRRLVDRDSRDRLVAAGLVRLVGAYVVAVKGAA